MDHFKEALIKLVPFILKTAVARLQNPFTLSLSKGERVLGPHPTGEHRKAVHASADFMLRQAQHERLFLRSNCRF